MKASSQRRSFTVLMTALATLSGAAFALYELRGHTDILQDVIKISMLLAVASMCISYSIWTFTHLQKDTVFRGGLAGLLTGVAIVPVPYFTASFKTEIWRIHNSQTGSLLGSALEAIPLALLRGGETFQVITKASLVAVVASVILGVMIAKKVSPRV